MSPRDASRRLAAVWFADIVGYTSLSSRDEDGAIRLVGAFQEITNRVAAEHGGRVVKYIGDAVLAEFSSTDGALRAALTLQRDFERHPEAVPFGAALRVGLHVGEVIGADDGDIYGDGVNLASRLQTAAAPGRLFVSEAVHGQIRQRQVFAARSVGIRALKGLSKPIQVFEVAFAGQLLTPLPTPEPTAPRPAHYIPRSRAIAWGLTVALLTFAALGVWAAADDPVQFGAISNYSRIQLTFSGSAGSPRFSADGKAIGVIEEDGLFGGALLVIPAPGEAEDAPEQVATGVSDFAWGSDNQLVWSVPGSGATFTGTSDSTASRMGDGAWSDFWIDPLDGVLSRLDHGPSGTAVMSQRVGDATADTVLVASEGTRIREAAWSPNRKWLLASATAEDGRASLQLYPAAGGAPVLLLSQRVVNPRWSADGKAVFFISNAGRTRGLNVLPIDPKAGQQIGPVQPLFSGLSIESFDLAPDGSIVFEQSLRRSNLLDIPLDDPGRADFVTSGTAPVTTPALDPDGTTLAFVRNDEVWVAPAPDGATEARITDVASPISALRWSPDGRRIAFILQGASRKELMVVNADGGGTARVIRLAHALPYDLEPELTWVDGGNAVVYVGADDAGWPSILSRVDVVTDSDAILLERDTTEMGGVAVAYQGAVASPDGSRIVVGDGLGGLQLVDLADGSVAEIFPDTPGLPVLWTEDDQIVLRSMLNRRELWTLPAGGRTTTLLVELPEGCREVTLSLRGDRATCAVVQAFERDVWIASPEAR